MLKRSAQDVPKTSSIPLSEKEIRKLEVTVALKPGSSVPPEWPFETLLPETGSVKDLPAGVYTGIWWYAKFPEHYAGDAAEANTMLGEFDMKAWAEGIAGVIRAVKSDQVSLRLQNEFYEKSKHPLDTKQ